MALHDSIIGIVHWKRNQIRSPLPPPPTRLPAQVYICTLHTAKPTFLSFRIWDLRWSQICGATFDSPNSLAYEIRSHDAHYTFAHSVIILRGLVALFDRSTVSPTPPTR